MRWPLLAILCLWPTLTLAESRFTDEGAAILQSGLVETADIFILPAYRAQAAAAGALHRALDAYCTQTGDVGTPRVAFANSFLAWQRASIIQVGPIMDGDGPLRLQLWPDPKGFARRAVGAAIRQADPALVRENGLAGRSIALVNLTALESLVFDDLAPGSYACALTTAIAAYQSELAQSLVTAWMPGAAYRTQFDSAATGNARYASVDGLLRELLAGIVVYVDRLRQLKIERGLGTDPGTARPERTEATRSGLGLPSIATSFRALADLYAVPYGVFDMAPDLGGAMDYYILGEMAATIADTLAQETQSLAEIAAEDGATAAQLRSFGEMTLNHEDFLKTGLPQSIGLTSGFTSSDGD